jgi:nucleoid DNA-binding protein
MDIKKLVRLTAKRLELDTEVCRAVIDTALDVLLEELDDNMGELFLKRLGLFYWRYVRPHPTAFGHSNHVGPRKNVMTQWGDKYVLAFKPVRSLKSRAWKSTASNTQKNSRRSHVERARQIKAREKGARRVRPLSRKD